MKAVTEAQSVLRRRAQTLPDRCSDKVSLWIREILLLPSLEYRSKSDEMRLWRSWREESVYFANGRDVNCYSQ